MDFILTEPHEKAFSVQSSSMNHVPFLDEQNLQPFAQHAKGSFVNGEYFELFKNAFLMEWFREFKSNGLQTMFYPAIFVE